MKKIIKVILAFIFIINLFSITSCTNDYYNAEEIKTVFSKYRSNEDLFVYSRGNLAFLFGEIDLYELISDKEMVDSVGVYNEKIYFTTTEDRGNAFDVKTVLRVYSYNKNANEAKEIYRKEDYPAHPSSLFVDEICYINYRIDIKQRTTDAYNLSTGEYNHIETKEQNNGNVLKDYEQDSGYEISANTITQKETNKTLDISIQSIKDTICYQDLRQYDYFLGKIDIYNGEIYIAYYVEVGSGWWYGKYVMFVFSLDFISETFEYETYVYTKATDIDNYRIMAYK